MTTSRPLELLVLAIACGALLVAGTASAGDRVDASTAGRAACGPLTELARAPLGLGSGTSPARSSALSSYDDEILDVVSAPDICQQNLVTNDSRVLTIGIHMHDRSGFSPTDGYAVLLDTDANPATGDPSEAGAEYVIDLADGASQLREWNGASFEAVVPQPEIPTEWVEDFGPALQFARSAVGDPQRVNVAFRTANLDDLDRAPDVGSWAYVVTPFRLHPGKLVVSPAREGTPLLAFMTVIRSDFEIPLDEGAIACRATVGGRSITGRRAFLGDRVSCTWRVPRGVKGKHMRGSVSVTYQSASATRSFVVRVR